MNRPVLAQLINGFGYFEVLGGLVALAFVCTMPEEAPRVDYGIAALVAVLIGLTHVALGFIMAALATMIERQKNVLPAGLPLQQFKATEKTNRLLEQLLRAYGHEPEA